MKIKVIDISDRRMTLVSELRPGELFIDDSGNLYMKTGFGENMVTESNSVCMTTFDQVDFPDCTVQVVEGELQWKRPSSVHTVRGDVALGDLSPPPVSWP